MFINKYTQSWKICQLSDDTKHVGQLLIMQTENVIMQEGVPGRLISHVNLSHAKEK